jgi:hypothetical protein
MSEQFSASTNLEKMMIQAAVQLYINALKQTHFHASMDNLSFIRINAEAINRTYITAKCK